MILKFKFDLQFFGGGGGSTSAETFRKRDPEDPQLTQLREKLFESIYPTLDNYDSSQWTKAQETADTALGKQMSILGGIEDYIGKGTEQDAGWQAKLDQWLGKIDPLLSQNEQLTSQAADWTGKTSALMDENDRWLGKTDDWLTKNNSIIDQDRAKLAGNSENLDSILQEMLGVTRTGNIPSALTDNMNASVNKELQSGMGSMLNSLGGRGVLNSSITGTGINGLAGNAADAYANNYLNAYNSVLGGYGSSLQGAQGNAQLDLSGMQQTQSAMGNQLSGIQTGFGGVQTGLSGIQTGLSGVGTGMTGVQNSLSGVQSGLSGVQSGAANAQNSWQAGLQGMRGAAGAYGDVGSNAFTNAGAQLMPAYNLWKDAQTLYNNREDFDTVVSQSGGK
jgi:hypothetical protein